jgi:GIY-YIG catalytic domain
MIGRLYKIESNVDGCFYIGSTRQELRTRLKNHKSKSKDPDRQQTPLYVYFNRVGWEHAEIQLLAEFDSIADSELLELEKIEILTVINDEHCLNKSRPIRTPDEKKQQDREHAKVRRRDNRDAELQRVKQWRIDNPEKYTEQCRRASERAKEKRAAKNISA